VIDNGCGMSRASLSVCAKPHFTSKITSFADLTLNDRAAQFGFRGEALAAVADVAERLEITSKLSDQKVFNVIFTIWH